MSEGLVLLRIAIRNLFASFLNIVIGGIVLVGTLLFVIGGSLLGSVDSSMKRSITGSVVGDVQVYSDNSKDDLAIFDAWNRPDLAVIPDFAKVKSTLLGVDNVHAVIPMGVDSATVSYGNTVDLALERLRHAVSARLKGDRSPETTEKAKSLIEHVRGMVSVIQGDYSKLTALTTEQAVDTSATKDLEHAASPEFWASFDADPLGHLEFLENHIAALVPDADMIYFGYVGTDLDAFQRSFDRMQVVDGQAVPPGHRGVLLAKYVYEEQFKLKTARRLDKIREALQDEGKKISGDPDLQLMVKQNKTQTREIVLQLDPLSARQVSARLAGFLGSKETELPKLLSSLFDTDDSNFLTRYRFFYDELAPRLELYRLKPGERLTIKNFTKSGFIQSVNVKVYGTFQFKGLEKSGLAGGLSLMDLMTFRDLYGYETPEKLAESKALQKSAGAAFVARDKAEDELFGGGGSVVESGQEKTIDDRAELGGVHYDATARETEDRAYSPKEIEDGIVMNAAIILKNPDRIDTTMQSIRDAAKSAGLELRVATWQKAAGNIGQFVLVAKVVLYFAVFIIFIVALVIINNAVMMATLQRVREIGTMRAIGAQRTFVLSLVLIETILLGLSFGSAGTLLGSAAVKWLGHVGIPAQNEFLYFFFSGPRLYVTLGMGNLVGAFIIICVVTSFSALYPAIVATRVSPLQAMQTED
jgi:ABC-type lipoprotein release transport system permease subunit